MSTRIDRLAAIRRAHVRSMSATRLAPGEARGAVREAVVTRAKKRKLHRRRIPVDDIG